MRNWNYGQRSITKASGLVCGPYYYLFCRPTIVEAGKVKKGAVRQIHIPSYLSDALTDMLLDSVVEKLDEQITRDGAIKMVKTAIQGWTQAVAIGEVISGENLLDDSPQCSGAGCDGCSSKQKC